MDKIWLNSYPAGVPAEIDVKAYTSVDDVLARACQEFPHRPAFRNLAATLKYSEVDRLARDFAAWLGSLPGLKRGSRIALMLPNVLQYPIAFFGTLRAGMIVVNVNPLYTARELEHQLTDSGAAAIVVLENFAHVVEKVLPRTQIQHVVTTQLDDLLGFPSRPLVNFVVKHRKKLVPPWHIRPAVSFSDCLRRGRAAPWKSAQGAICFSGEIGEGQKYRKDLSGDLAFVLSLPGGFAVLPNNAAADCERVFWVANPPFRAHRLTEIDALYDWTAEEEVQASPREFRFATDCAAYKTLYNQTDSDKFVTSLDSLRKGQGRFWITASRVTHSHGLNGEHNGAVEWIKFSLEIKLPKTD